MSSNCKKLVVTNSELWGCSSSFVLFYHGGKGSKEYRNTLTKMLSVSTAAK